jgi:diacylglycerol kinase family enzyme
METSLRETPPGDAAPPRRRLALVLNEKAGALLAAGGDGTSLLALLQDAGLTVETIGQGTLPDRLAAARDLDTDVIALAGGDGTVACAAGALAGTGRALGIIPCGTMNLLAKDLGIPAGDHAEAVRILAAGDPRHIDVGTAGDHVFLCAVMFGTPARLGHFREAGRRRGNGLLGWLHFVRAALHSLRRHHPLRLTVTVDGTQHLLRTPSLTVTVNALDDHSGRMFGRTRLDGGELVAYALRPSLGRDLPHILVNILRGRFARDPAVRILRGRAFGIATNSDGLRVLVDGEEHVMPTPVRLHIRPQALTVIGR